MFSTRYNSEQKIWSGRHLTPFHHESVSLGRALYYTLSYNRRRVAQIFADTDHQVTDGEICDQMLTIASHLEELGVKRGQVIAVVAKNGPTIAPTVFAAFCLGVAVNTLDPNYSINEIIHMFRQTQPSIIFCDHDNHSRVQGAVSQIPSEAKIINFGPRIPGVDNIDDYLVATGKEDPLSIPDVDAQTCALIQCSSGTTGMAKGVSLSHQHMLYLVATRIILENRQDSSMLCFSSLYWISGIANLLLTTFLGMTRIITTQNFNAELFLDIVKKYQVTHLITNPFQLASLLNHKSLTPTTLGTVHEYIVAGSVVPKDNWEKMQTFLPNGSLRILYGMTEMGCNSYQDYNSTKYCVGKLAPDVLLKIVDDQGQKCSLGEIGEIYLKPRFVFLGYYGNAKATSDAYEDGWFKSGDIGRMDEDGDLHIIDRRKEILKYSNHHVSPSEIEQIIFAHSDVKYVAVVGIPDPVCTDLPAAVVVLKDGASVTADEIFRLVASQLSDPKHLRGGVYFVNELPLTPSGKVIKGKVKEWAIEFYNKCHT